LDAGTETASTDRQAAEAAFLIADVTVRMTVGRLRKNGPKGVLAERSMQ
jgi:hypothetical protein